MKGKEPKKFEDFHKNLSEMLTQYVIENPDAPKTAENSINVMFSCIVKSADKNFSKEEGEKFINSVIDNFENLKKQK